MNEIDPTCPHCGAGVCPGCFAEKRGALARELEDPNQRLIELVATLVALSKGRWQCCRRHAIEESPAWTAHQLSALGRLQNVAAAWRALRPIIVVKPHPDGVPEQVLESFDGLLDAAVPYTVPVAVPR